MPGAGEENTVDAFRFFFPDGNGDIAEIDCFAFGQCRGVHAVLTATRYRQASSPFSFSSPSAYVGETDANSDRRRSR